VIMDIVCRQVPGYGWLGLIMKDGREEYRTGSFWPDAEQALAACQAMAAKLWGTP